MFTADLQADAGEEMASFTLAVPTVSMMVVYSVLLSYFCNVLS